MIGRKREFELLQEDELPFQLVMKQTEICQDVVRLVILHYVGGGKQLLVLGGGVGDVSGGFK